MCLPFFLLINIRVKYLHRMFADFDSLGWLSLCYSSIEKPKKMRIKRRKRVVFIFMSMIGKVNILCAAVKMLRNMRREDAI